ncbi:MAG TPA: hypothetical protein V6C72_01300 [Chroococcales cyanobacterium]
MTNKVSMKQKGKKVVHRSTGGQAQSLPVNSTPSNESYDRLAYVVLFGLLFVALALVVGGVAVGVHGVVEASTHQPIDWWKLVTSVLLAALCVVAARSVSALALFGSVMLASKQGAWKSVETISKKATQYKRFIPGGVQLYSTAAIQSLVNRGQYKESLDLAEREWNEAGGDPKKEQGLGTICFAAGIASQGEANVKQSQLWNDRAISILVKQLEELKQPPKGMMAKLARTQAQDLEGQIRVQLAAAYFNCATMHFNVQDYRRAKENFRQAVDSAVKAPEFPQKAEIIKFGNEQLARLKHT